MQELDQQVAMPGAGAQKFADLGERAIVERPSFRSAIACLPSLHRHTISSKAERPLLKTVPAAVGMLFLGITYTRDL